MKFNPKKLLRNPHFQTVFSMLRPAPNLRTAKQIWIPVEENIALEGRHDIAPNSKGDAVLLLHGLGGSSASRLVRSMASFLLSQGFDTFRITMRGFEESMPFFPTLFHFGKVQDLTKAVNYVRKQGYKRVMMVSVSLSAAFMLNWLKRRPRKIDGAVAISPPMDLVSTLSSMDHPKNRFYQKYFLNILSGLLHRKRKLFPDNFTKIISKKSMSSIEEYETHTTVPFYGLKDVHSYYRQNSFHGKWNKIQNPLLVVHAEDDPILGSIENYRQKYPVPNNVRMIVSPEGGHVGFHEDFTSGSTVERWVANYFNSLEVRSAP